MSKTLSIGAEAVLLLDEKKNVVLKRRIKKNYRIQEIDNKLRKFRTKREFKLLNKCLEIGIDAPKPIDVNLNEYMIAMGYIRGKKLRDVVNKDNYELFSKIIGHIIEKLHMQGIIHHDLTTSNLLWDGKKLYLIDFGLSFYSHKIEDKAVDLHLLKRALESKHPEFCEEFFTEILKHYNPTEKGKIIKRLKNIELRGRYNTRKHKMSIKGA